MHVPADLTARDRRDSPSWTRVEDFLRASLEPGFGRPVDAEDLSPHPDGRRVAFTSSWWESLEGRPGSRIAVADVTTGTVDVVTNGPHSDRRPSWSPDGRR